MKFSWFTHLFVSLILSVTYIGGSFVACFPHHTYASGETIRANIEDGHTHIHTDIPSVSTKGDTEQDDHCKEGNLGWVDIYVHKDSFHDITQLNLLSIIPVPFFMVQEKNDAYFYREWIWIYTRQLYESEVAYTNERKNTIEILI